MFPSVIGEINSSGSGNLEAYCYTRPVRVAGLSILLASGIGDTIRVSLTPEPDGDRTEEVLVAMQVLQSLGLRSFRPQVSACPGCGRTTSTFFQEMAQRIEGHITERMPVWSQRYAGVEDMNVAVMGCVVNGPGESKHADIGISLPGTFEDPVAPVFVDGALRQTLRGDGLVKTRQGVGAFVAEDAQQRPFRIDPDQLVSLHNVLNIMELRMSVEIEAAGLAAERRTASQLKRISDALDAIENDLDRNDYAVDNDFKFHCAIAEATGNPYYVKFLEFLGNFIIPRQTVNFISGSERNQLDYLRGVQKEHRQIDAAIADADAKLARDVMRRHIVSSRRRYEIIAKKLEKRDG